MGGAKAAWLESEELGWDAPEKNVCANCLTDTHLTKLIETVANSHECDYCGRRANTPIAAPVEVLMPAVLGTLNCYFAEPAGAGVPYETAEGGFLVEPMDTAEALSMLPLDCHAGLFQDIVDAISNDSWVEAAYGHWASEPIDRLLSNGWKRFAFHVKHRQRYFFTTADPEYGQDIEPFQLMPALAEVISRLKLVATIPAEYTLYRVRIRSPTDSWPSDAKNLGAPPPARATAGRMNPPGISYMYLALDESTAVAEAVRSPPCIFVVGRFQTSRDLRVLDLTDLPAPPPKFEYEEFRTRQQLLFLANFVDAITREVEKDGSEHIEYVPSQIVCEYFASVFDPEDPLDGILYPSAVKSGGKNLVLFPRHDKINEPFPQVTFMNARIGGTKD